MRRSDRAITDGRKIEEIISTATVCRIGMCDKGIPYVVPVCFGYSDGTIYFHSAYEGKKIEILKRNNRVCFEFESDVNLLKSDQPCRYTMKYRSVIGFGLAYFVDDEREKKEAFDLIMRNYSGKFDSYSYKGLDKVLIIKIVVDSMTGKESGF